MEAFATFQQRGEFPPKRRKWYCSERRRAKTRWNALLRGYLVLSTVTIASAQHWTFTESPHHETSSAPLHVQRGAARIMYGSGSLRPAQAPHVTGAKSSVPPLAQIPPNPTQPSDRHAPSDYDRASPYDTSMRSGGGHGRSNGAYGSVVGVGRGSSGGRDAGYPGRPYGINPGQRMDYGVNANKDAIVHGRLIERVRGQDGKGVHPLGPESRGDTFRVMEPYIEEDDQGGGGSDYDHDQHPCGDPCQRGEFECLSTCSCIPMENRCDGSVECSGGEDEDNCEEVEGRELKVEAPCLEKDNKLRCPHTLECISKDWLCDGDDDCGDYSDETHCGGPVNCTVDQFECGNGLCVQKTWLCDGDNDCKDNTDEYNCSRAACASHEFQCLDGRCIAGHWKCDKEADCADRSDEANCPITLPNCGENEFFCLNDKCIRKDFQCDGDNDCEDWSDEDNCPDVPGSCNTGEFRCNDGKCISMRWRCDKEHDCFGREDEENCGPENTRTCSRDEYACEDGRCILTTWVCDGVPDCAKGEDESLCNVHCEEGQYMCRRHTNETSSAIRTCVNKKHVCDGQKDCPLGDDEEKCPVKKECEPGSKCQQFCLTTVDGKEKCACNPGYQIAYDGFSCRDIDECMYAQDPVCSQTCSNTIGSFTCGCMTGYVLRPDLRTCKATGGSPMLLFSNRAEIRQVSLSNDKYSSLIKGLHNVVALDYHYTKQLLFFSETTLDVIRVASLNGSEIKDIIKWGLDSAGGLSVDWIHDLLFWTDSGTRRVEVATLDGKLRSVIAASDLDKPRAIAVHPGDALVFWTDWGPNPKIERADMDGSNRKSIVIESIFWPNGLTIDYISTKLYWADAKHHVIECVSFDGSERKKVATKGLPHPFAITIFEDAIFWTDWHTKSISTVNKKTGVGFQTIHGSIVYPMDIHSYHPQRQPMYNNHCGASNGGCTHMCLPNHASYSCRCPVGLSLDSDMRTCKTDREKLLLFARKKDIRIKQLSTKRNNINVDLVIPLDGIKSAVALAWDQEKNAIFWTDVERDTINRANLNGSDQRILVENNLISPAGLAFDWLTSKLYWTDAGTNRIEVSNSDGTMRTLLFWEDIDKPRDIVLDPNVGLMYWSDWGTSPCIETAAMDGSSRKKIITGNLTWPNGLALDSARQRLYWTDGGTRKIEHSNFDGTDRVILIGTDLPHPFGLDIYRDEIFWTDWDTLSIQAANKITGKNRRTLSSSVIGLMDVRVYHKDRKWTANRCNNGKANGGCSHLCLLNPGGYSCACPIGIKLMADKKTCALGPTNYLIFAHRLDIRQISLDVPYVIDVVVPLPPLKNALAVDVDRKTGEIYWTDTHEDLIRKATPDGKTITPIIDYGLHTSDGIVIDSAGRKIYWTDTGRNSIEVAELDGSNRKLLIWTDLDSPRAITLHYHRGWIYWSDWGANAKIERADMDGQDRKLIINENLVWPNGLAIDRPAGRLYWNDAKRMVIESSDLSGQDRVMLLSKVPYPYGLVVVGNHVYWTDWKTQALHRADKRNGSDNVIIRDKLEGLMDIRSVQADNTAENACGNNNNGGCSHLCLRSPRGFTCACPTGLLFKDTSDDSPFKNNKICQTYPNEFLLFATKNTLARISLSTPELWDVALPTKNIVKPIAVDFHYEKKLMFHSDVERDVIQSISMEDPTKSKLIVSGRVNTPHGLAVDWIADNIYWTENEQKVIEVARIDGSCRKLIITTNLSEPRSVAVFPRKGYLFWTDWNDNARIERSMLDGSSRKIIVIGNLGFPNGLTIEYKAKRLYWADSLKDRIETSDINGDRRIMLVPEANHPFGLTQYKDYIYWTDWYTKTLFRANKTSGQDVTTIRTDMGYLMEIKAVTAEHQKGWNPCKENNGGCSHLCFFRGDNYTCACPDTPDKLTCVTVPAKWVSLTRPGSETDPDEYDLDQDSDDNYDHFNVSSTHPVGKVHSSVTLFSIYFAMVLLKCIVLMALGGACYWYCKRRGRTRKDDYRVRDNAGLGNCVISFPNPNYSGGVTTPGSGSGEPHVTIAEPDRKRHNRFQIFKYERSQERVTNVFSAEGASLIPPANTSSGSHTPPSHFAPTPDSHSQQDDGFDSIALHPIG